MANNAFPSDWREQPCYLVSVPRPLVPYVGGLLRLLELRGFWATEEDYIEGYTATIALEACLMATCLDVLLEKQDSMYRMLDTALFGTEYTVESEDPLVVTPAIAPTHNLAFESYDSALGRLARIADVVDNAINGTITPEYSYTPSVKDKLQAVIDAIEASATDNAGIIDELTLILGALA